MNFYYLILTFVYNLKQGVALSGNIICILRKKKTFISVLWTLQTQMHAYSNLEWVGNVNTIDFTSNYNILVDK
jgi:hypothetical protein